MRILIIGGTRFLGRALSEATLERGHELTLFHRGQTNPDLFPQAEHIQGNRDGEIENLGDGQWDAVIDTCGYVPRIVGMSAAYLADKVKHYVFISSISAYTETTEVNRDEDAPLATMDDPTSEEMTGESYGPLKVLCEQAAEEALPGRTTIIRPGLIVGPHDPSNRFTYWPVRIRKGGDVLIPDAPTMPSQIIDVRDIAEFTLTVIENEAIGIYNVCGPQKPHTFNDIFDACKEVSGSHANLIPVSEEFLTQQEVGPWMEMPLWLPDETGKALMHVNVDRAVQAGLTFRSLQDTIRATLDWYDEIQGDEQEWSAGMKAEREQELLAIYQNPA